jgi:hypothetical protein
MVQRCSPNIRRRIRSTLCRLLNPRIHLNSSVLSLGPVGFDGGDGEHVDRRECTRARFLGTGRDFSRSELDILFGLVKNAHMRIIEAYFDDVVDLENLLRILVVFAPFRAQTIDQRSFRFRTSGGRILLQHVTILWSETLR